MSVILGPDGRPLPPMPLVKAGIDSALATGSLPDGAVAQSDLSGMARALGDGLSVTNSLGPGVPMGPAHPEERSPRWWDYVPGANVTITPRQGEQYPFSTLYALANIGSATVDWSATGTQNWLSASPHRHAGRRGFGERRSLR